MKKSRRAQDDPKVKIGAKEFQDNKNAMLDIFELAKIQNMYRTLQTDKINVAEAALKDWLAQFLPKKFSVSSGYIISKGNQTTNKLLHYDVIIYDAMNAPIILVEKNTDHSD